VSDQQLINLASSHTALVYENKKLKVEIDRLENRSREISKARTLKDQKSERQSEARNIANERLEGSKTDRGTILRFGAVIRQLEDQLSEAKGRVSLLRLAPEDAERIKTDRRREQQARLDDANGRVSFLKLNAEVAEQDKAELQASLDDALLKLRRINEWCHSNIAMKTTIAPFCVQVRNLIEQPPGESYPPPPN
jgi:chromosome segregation ATPase